MSAMTFRQFRDKLMNKRIPNFKKTIELNNLNPTQEYGDNETNKKNGPKFLKKMKTEQTNEFARQNLHKNSDTKKFDRYATKLLHGKRKSKQNPVTNYTSNLITNLNSANRK